MHPGKVEITSTLNFATNIVIVPKGIDMKMKELTVFILVSLLMGRQNNVAENISVVDKVIHPFQCCNFVLDT
jgi:hypothetical protein